MERTEMDNSILEAIITLKNEGKSPTAINIQKITSLRLYQIYSSKHKDLLEVRSRRSRHIQPEVSSEVLLEKISTTDIDLIYKHFGIHLSIHLKDATLEEIDESINDLEFISRKSIERLQREKAKLH